MNLKIDPKNIAKKLKMVDWWIILILFIFYAIGLVILAKVMAEPFTGEEKSLMDYVAKFEFSYIRRQTIFFLTGLLWIALFCAMDYRSLARLTNVGWLVIMAALVLVLFFGKDVAGTKRWFQMGSFNLQPSEYAKLLIIILASKLCAESVDKYGRVMVNQAFFKTVGMVALIVLLILFEPDTGTSIVCLLIFALVVFAGRLSWKAVLAIAGIAIAAFAVLFFTGGENGLMKDYARMRIVNFLGINNERVIEVLKIDPTKAERFDSTQVEIAKISMAGGGIWGKGFFSTGSNAQLRYLPYAHTDFIFAAAVETFGFVGGVVIIFLYLALLVRCVMLAFRARDNFGFFIIIGVVGMILAHVFENIGMNIGIMPVTGIPLPFVSYGGSSMWANMLALGLVLMVNMQRDTKRRQHSNSPSDL